MTLSTRPIGALLELTVHNHAGVFAQVSNLCSRRAYVIEGVLALPAADAAERSLWLLLTANCSLEQVERQLLKLQDVRAVRRHGGEHPLLVRLAELHGLAAHQQVV